MPPLAMRNRGRKCSPATTAVTASEMRTEMASISSAEAPSGAISVRLVYTTAVRPARMASSARAVTRAVSSARPPSSA